ncbi:hypothetical protein F4810DRAFT_709714 [Camillea tinctor]|nr:hypothetical protein F4810DRAFT_709714 [Camillea tinctor]
MDTISEERKAWNDLELDRQCKDVLNLLSENKRRWDSSTGSPDILLLEDYKKQTLAERKEHSDCSNSLGVQRRHPETTFTQDRKYLPVWEVVDPVAQVLAQARDEAEKLAALARLVRALCTKPSA